MRLRENPSEAHVDSAPPSRAPGAFSASGAYHPWGHMEDRGPVDRLVRALVRARGTGISPAEATNMIDNAGGGQDAFPNRAQWYTCKHWSHTACTTNAEETVKRQGRGTDGHWCAAQQWAPGAERECRSIYHRRGRGGE